MRRSAPQTLRNRLRNALTQKPNIAGVVYRPEGFGINHHYTDSAVRLHKAVAKKQRFSYSTL
jgi:hypothetical protein